MWPLSPKKRGAVWRIDFKKTGDFLAQIWAVSPFGDFSPKRKKKNLCLTGQWPSTIPIPKIPAKVQE